MNVLKDVLQLTVQQKYNGSIDCDEVGIPMKNSDLVLPCGIYARWEKEKYEE
jgi:23S rRNA (cytosine1962-C5)-methyltransferase